MTRFLAAVSFVAGAVLAVLGFPFGSLFGFALLLVGLGGVVTGLTYLVRGETSRPD